MRLVSRRTRPGCEAKAKISLMTASPSWVIVEEGGPLLRKVQTGWLWPLSVVPRWTQPSWTSSRRTSRGREASVVADLDVVAAGGGVGDDAVRETHAHRPGIAEIVLHSLRQCLDRFRRGQAGLLMAEDRLVRQVVEDVGHHVSEIDQVRVAGVEAVRRRAVKPLRDFGEDRRAAVRQHVDDFAVLLAHAGHDLPGRVELAQLPANIPLDDVQLVELLFWIEGEGAREVIVAGDGGQLAAALLEKGAFDLVVPLDGVENADRALGFDKAIAQAANQALVGTQGPVARAVAAIDAGFTHRVSTWEGPPPDTSTLCSVT